MLKPRFSHHAREALAGMPDVTEGDVFRCINEYDNRYGQNYDPNKPQRLVYQGGNIAVVTDTRTTVIITVLYRRQEQWERKRARN